MLPETFQCYLVTKDSQGNLCGQISERPLNELPDGEVLIRVAYSSLNYKDALAATGHPGVNKVFPHVPGVDAAGTVAQSGVYEFVEGDPVLVTGFDMGSNRWGGLAQYVRVPQEWVVPLPEGLSLRESMILGTAGLTAGFCVHALEKHDVTPDSGQVVVTGASGGVGSFAVALLAKLGYHVTAITGKAAAHDYLKSLGAEQILGREAVNDQSGKPLLSGRWAGAVDTVGGNMLGTILRATRHGGCVATCGMTAGDDLPVTVYPFILRGVTLAGIDSAWCPIPLRHETWARLAGQWKLDCLDTIARFIDLAELPSRIDDILAGRVTGRLVIAIDVDKDARLQHTQENAIMATKNLTDEQMRRCVFTQPYRKIGPNQFSRERPYIDIDLPGDDLPEKYANPVLETKDDTAPTELRHGASALVRVYDERAISPSATQGYYERADLLGDIDDAQRRCDEKLESEGACILDYLSES